MTTAPVRPVSTFGPTTFVRDEGVTRELVPAKCISVHSLCEHYLLPFHGAAHIGYLPGERILGLMARLIGELRTARGNDEKFFELRAEQAPKTDFSNYRQSR